MKRFFLLAAMLCLTMVGTASAIGRTSPPPSPPDFGTCKYYCGSTPYNTLAACAAACGGPQNCEDIC
ncbi:MAG TPA: hypothetical protein VKE22_15610 [Haliangiales bacterium]|nr:hypothetical protein [Haliangiales bacterium]